MRYDPSEPRPRRPRAPRACGVGVRASSIAADRPPPAAPGRMCAPRSPRCPSPPLAAGSEPGQNPNRSGLLHSDLSLQTLHLFSSSWLRPREARFDDIKLGSLWLVLVERLYTIGQTRKHGCDETTSTTHRHTHKHPADFRRLLRYAGMEKCATTPRRWAAGSTRTKLGAQHGRPGVSSCFDMLPQGLRGHCKPNAALDVLRRRRVEALTLRLRRSLGLRLPGIYKRAG